jgi:hypothetical protein
METSKYKICSMESGIGYAQRADTPVWKELMLQMSPKAVFWKILPTYGMVSLFVVFRLSPDLKRPTTSWRAKCLLHTLKS